MILIADSGSTKTDWRLIDDNKQIHQCATQGFNPYFQTREELFSIIEKELLPSFSTFNSTDGRTSNQSSISIFFYGAGCSSNSKKQIVFSAFQELFPKSIIEVNTDLLGAARATCGKHAGIVAILGTGASTCYYDGNGIVESIASLGYVLGDEGSGAHIGKSFLKAFLDKELPKGLSERFFERYKLGKDEILDALYKQPNPNRFLASFSTYIYQNLNEQIVIDLVADCFSQFFDKHICKYKQHKTVKLSCVGSVAFYYSNILRAIATNKGVNIETIIETPIAGLTLYHEENPS